MEMQSFFFLFTRYLAERAKSQELYVILLIQDDCDHANTWVSEWDRIRSPAAEQIVPYDKLPNETKPDNLNKLAVLKVNGGLGTSMGMRREKRIYIRLLTHDICQV